MQNLKTKNGVKTKNKRTKQKKLSLKIVHITPLAGNLEGLFKKLKNKKENERK